MSVKMAFAGTGYISKIHAKAAERLPGVEWVNMQVLDAAYESARTGQVVAIKRGRS